MSGKRHKKLRKIAQAGTKGLPDTDYHQSPHRINFVSNDPATGGQKLDAVAEFSVQTLKPGCTRKVTKILKRGSQALMRKNGHRKVGSKGPAILAAWMNQGAAKRGASF